MLNSLRRQPLTISLWGIISELYRREKIGRMKKVKVYNDRLSGTVSVPPSKSAAHRAIICASLSRGKSVISPVEMSEDVRATIECMKSLGTELSLEGRTLTVDGSKTLSAEKALLNCGESGSTLRFLIPVAAVGGVDAVFTGRGRLPERPIGVFTECLPEKGVACETGGGLPLHINGRLQSGVYRIPGNISSQFITGLLLALPLADGDSDIILTSPAQSVGYIRMTTNIMEQFGVSVEETAGGWHIRGGQSYSARSFTVEGDWSQAAFFMTAAALGGRITIDNLSLASRQGDRACMELYSRFGAVVTAAPDGSITIEQGSLHGTEIDASDIPDLVPALAVTAAVCEGTTVIRGAGRLRIKECDRLAAMSDGLSRLGADVQETADGLIIHGVRKLHGGSVEGCNDHRIVMSFTVAAAAADGEIIISDPDSINKSYPSFFEDHSRLGGRTDVIMG